MRSKWQGGQQAAAAQQQRRGAGASASGAAPPSPPPAAHPAAAQLLAALNWEASNGYADGVGRTGEHFSAWAAGRLRQLGGELQQGAGPGGDLAAQCASLAEELGGYSGLNAAGRVLLTQRVRLTVEELLHAVAAGQQQPQRQAAQQAAPSSSGATPAAAPAVGDALREQAGGPEGAAAVAGAGARLRLADEVAAAQEQWEAQPAQPGAPGRAPAAAAGASGHYPSSLGGEEKALEDSEDSDAAAALAHEEETATNGSVAGQLPAGAPLLSLKPGEAAGAGGAEGPAGAAGEAPGEKKKRAVAPATLGFRKSFAEAAAAFSLATGAPGVRGQR